MAAEVGHELVARPPIHTPSFAKFHPEEARDVFIYYEDQPDNFRYKLTVVDRKPTSRLQYATAVFLIPAGREGEFMFSFKGLQSIADSAQTARLIAVTFGRHHEFQNSEAVQQELNYVVQVLSQQGNFLPLGFTPLQSKTSIPFMALAGIGKRNIIAEGESPMSGKYIIEQVQVEDKVFRRLYFMDNAFVIQTEAIVRGDIIEKSFAAFEYHKTMVAGICALADDIESGLLVGLGGGSLVNYMQAILPSIKLSAIELDPVVAKIAKEFFAIDENLDIRIGDGLHLSASNQAAEDGILCYNPGTLSFVVIDVDSKDKTSGMSCPPTAFVQVDYLQRISELLKDGGVLTINVSARDHDMLQMVRRNAKEVFRTVILSDQANSDEEREDINVVLFALLLEMNELSKSRLLNRLESSLNKFGRCDEILVADLSSYFEDLSLMSEEYGEVLSEKKKAKHTKKRGKKK